MTWTEAPVFLCGHRKSGTTLLLSLFDNHPDYSVFPPDSGFWYGFFPRYASDTFSFDEKIARMKSVFFLNLEDDFKNLDCYEEGKYQVHFDGMCESFVERMKSRKGHWKDFLVSGMEAFHEFHPCKRSEPLGFIEKTTSTEIYACEIKDSFPTAKFIHLVRDPRDNYASLKSGWSARYQDQNDTVERLLQSMLERGLLGLRMAIENQKIFKDSYYVLRYEDLVHQPEEEMRKLCDFLSIEYSSSLLVPTYLGLPWKGNNFDGLSFSKPDPVNAGRWKERITEHEAGVIEFHGRDLMLAHNYELSIDPALASRAAAEHYKWHNFAQVYSSAGAAETYKEAE